jgi:hypothetical protein
MSLSEQMMMEEEIEDLREQLTKIMLSVPTNMLGFDGNIPLYVQNAFDAQQAEIDRLTSELENQRKRGDSLATAFREAQGNEDKMLVELKHLHACNESGDSKKVTNELELQNKKLEEAKRAAEKLAEELNTQMTIL